MSVAREPLDVCIVGGSGHVGAPLSVVLARKGYRVLIYDLNRQAMAEMAQGRFPFMEEDSAELLREVLDARRLHFTTDPADIRDIPYLIITIGTPVDEHQNPVLRVVTDCVNSLLPFLSDQQTLILRSTVVPGVTDFVHEYLADRGKHPRIAFCPERVVQGLAIREIQSLPQIISGTTPEAEEAAATLFRGVAASLVRMRPIEAEFAKLFCNAYRYIQFAAANQFYMLAESAGVNFARIMAGFKANYPRMQDFPRPGFAAGPCLYKDTQQLAAFAQNLFGLGNVAIQVNEGMPGFIVELLASRYTLKNLTVGLLGMAFKANCDDRRDSLSYKLKKLLRFRARQVLTTDPYVREDPELQPVEKVLAESDVLILCTPHADYADLELKGKPLLDIWNFHHQTAAAQLLAAASNGDPRTQPAAPAPGGHETRRDGAAGKPPGEPVESSPNVLGVSRTS
jgi:UDP-N-acetyl-D-mannosaminuronic acid dehydrogenase